MANNYINFEDDLVERLQIVTPSPFCGIVSEFDKKVNLNRRNLYEIFKGEQKPQLDTVIKILKELGYSLKVA